MWGLVARTGWHNDGGRRGLWYEAGGCGGCGWMLDKGAQVASGQGKGVKRCRGHLHPLPCRPFVKVKCLLSRG